MKKNNEPEVSFDAFLEVFPEVELPVTLSADLDINFSKRNPPLPPVTIDRFIVGNNGGALSDDEYTEYVPCFRVPETYEFQAVVYWRGGLLDYQYILATYDKTGVLLDRATIAGTTSDGAKVVQSVANFDDDWTIRVISGVSQGERFVPANSSITHLELLPDGTIKRE